MEELKVDRDYRLSTIARTFKPAQASHNLSKLSSSWWNVKVSFSAQSIRSLTKFNLVKRHRVLRKKRGQPADRVHALLRNGDSLRGQAILWLRWQGAHRCWWYASGDCRQELWQLYETASSQHCEVGCRWEKQSATTVDRSWDTSIHFIASQLGQPAK